MEICNLPDNESIVDSAGDKICLQSSESCPKEKLNGSELNENNTDTRIYNQNKIEKDIKYAAENQSNSNGDQRLNSYQYTDCSEVKKSDHEISNNIDISDEIIESSSSTIVTPCLVEKVPIVESRESVSSNETFRIKTNGDAMDSVPPENPSIIDCQETSDSVGEKTYNAQIFEPICDTLLVKMPLQSSDCCIKEKLNRFELNGNNTGIRFHDHNEINFCKSDHSEKKEHDHRISNKLKLLDETKESSFSTVKIPCLVEKVQATESLESVCSNKTSESKTNGDAVESVPSENSLMDDQETSDTMSEETDGTQILKQTCNAAFMPLQAADFCTKEKLDGSEISINNTDTRINDHNKINFYHSTDSSENKHDHDISNNVELLKEVKKPPLSSVEAPCLVQKVSLIESKESITCNESKMNEDSFIIDCYETKDTVDEETDVIEILNPSCKASLVRFAVVKLCCACDFFQIP